MDRLTGMSVFAAAVAEGSLVAAARRHGLSPSMAGKHVAAIELELGVRLLQRSTRSLALTDAGQAYLARCRRILDEHEEARREAGETQGDVRGLLRVAAPVTYATMHLAGPMAEFLEQHPSLVLDVVLSDRYVDLLADGIDVAIRIGRLHDSTLIARRLAPCGMVLCASPAFVAAQGSLDEAAAIRSLPRLAYSDPMSVGDWTLIDPAGEPHVLDGPVRLRANNMELLLAAALRGMGIAYGPSFAFDARVAAGDLIVLLPDHATQDLTVHAVYVTSRHVPRRMRAFVDHLASRLGGDAAGSS